MLFARLFFRSACRVSSASAGLSSTSRMSLGSMSFHLSVCGRGTGHGRLQGEEKGGAALQFRLHANFPAVPVNDALHRSQTDPRALEFFLSMEALKNAEQLIGVFGIKAHAIVTDEESGRIRRAATPHFDDGALARAREFRGIGQKV